MEDILKELEQIVNNAGKELNDEYNQSQLDLLVASDKRLKETLFEEEKELGAILCVGTVISEDEWEASGGDLAANTVGPTYDAMVNMSSDLHRAGMKPMVGVKNPSDMREFFDEKTLTCVLYEQTNYISLLLRVVFSPRVSVTYMTTPNGIGILRSKKDMPVETWYVPFTEEGSQVAAQLNDILTDKQSYFAQEMSNAQIMPAKTKKEFPMLWAGLMELAKSRHSEAFDDDDTE
jgi:hypothetical protein